MPESDSEALHEVPGGARRADTFLLVVVTVIAAGSVAGFWRERPPVVALFLTAAWLQIFARWLRHVRPGSVRAVEYLGAVVLGAALYAGMTSL